MEPLLTPRDLIEAVILAVTASVTIALLSRAVKRWPGLDTSFKHQFWLLMGMIFLWQLTRADLTLGIELIAIVIGGHFASKVLMHFVDRKLGTTKQP